MAFLVLALALALAAAEATVVPEAVFTTAAAAEGAVVSPSVESLESPPGRLARLLVDLHRLRQARLLAGVALPLGRSCWSGWRGCASTSTVSSRAEWKSCTRPSI